MSVKQALQNKSSNKAYAIQMGHRLREGLLIISAAVALFLLISFVSYNLSDPGWTNTGMGDQVFNLGGKIGAFLADLFLSLFGYLAYLLPPMIVFIAWIGVSDSKEESFRWLNFGLIALGFILIVISGCGILALYLHNANTFKPDAGGIIGDIAVKALTNILNVPGSTLLLITLLLCGVTLFAGLSWIYLLRSIGLFIFNNFIKLINFIKEKRNSLPKPNEQTIFALKRKIKKSRLSSNEARVKTPTSDRHTPLIKPKPKAKELKAKKAIKMSHGNLPPLSMLDAYTKANEKPFSNVTFEKLSELLEQILFDFGVQVKVVAVHPGPVITRFELDLAPGVKVSKISGLAKDIARSLSVSSVRVVEVIPGKSCIGLEIPNEHRELVALREVLESQRYAQSKSPVSLALGKDIAGFPVIVDLAKMPHLLVAGTTGSGKSVSLNAMLLSVLFKATPEDLRLIMIDPKMLELSVYEGIPHLLAPVITDMKDAANALRWCVAEMDRRYRLMAHLGVRNLTGYNSKVSQAAANGKPIESPEWFKALNENSPEHLEAMPMIVVVVDELADMMMVVGKKVEELVTRIAQKARAAGIHLILATQRPSVDVITGLIKANIPTRVAFQVSSRVDSRTILDQQGAEQLLGNGDMLYLPPGTGVPVRVHGAYVGDDEVHRLVAAWRSIGKPAFIEEVTEEVNDSNSNSENGSEGESDPLYDDALRIVTETRRASISLVQRRLRIGYNRAARIMEDMERSGVVSVMDGSGSREVLAPPPVTN